MITSKVCLVKIVFLDESCKMKNADLLGAILVKCRKLGPFGEVCGGSALQLCRKHVSLKSNVKKLLQKNYTKKKCKGKSLHVIEILLHCIML